MSEGSGNNGVTLTNEQFKMLLERIGSSKTAEQKLVDIPGSPQQQAEVYRRMTVDAEAMAQLPEHRLTCALVRSCTGVPIRWGSGHACALGLFEMPNDLRLGAGVVSMKRGSMIVNPNFGGTFIQDPKTRQYVFDWYRAKSGLSAKLERSEEGLRAYEERLATNKEVGHSLAILGGMQWLWMVGPMTEGTRSAPRSIYSLVRTGLIEYLGEVPIVNGVPMPPSGDWFSLPALELPPLKETANV